MKILHNYLLSQFLRALLVCLLISTILFLVFDFFERLEIVLVDDPSFKLIFKYFLYKIPVVMALMLPVSMLVATLYTVGMLSKNSEMTAMRAAGLTILWIAKPLFITGISVSALALLLNETLLPQLNRRVQEIYNIDIKQRHQNGGLSKDNIWWRNQNQFFSASFFDSRDNTLHDFSSFELNPEFDVHRRTDSQVAKWVPYLGWSMSNIDQYSFFTDDKISIRQIPIFPLPISQTPQFFYRSEIEPETMSFFELNSYVQKLKEDGIATAEYTVDLLSKFAFPLINLIVVLVVLPFALKPARSGNLATSSIAGIAIGFSYYVINAFSIAMGRAELWDPWIAAWMANLLMGSIGIILNWGAEAP